MSVLCRCWRWRCAVSVLSHNLSHALTPHPYIPPLHPPPLLQRQRPAGVGRAVQARRGAGGDDQTHAAVHSRADDRRPPQHPQRHWLQAVKGACLCVCMCVCICVHLCASVCMCVLWEKGWRLWCCGRCHQAHADSCTCKCETHLVLPCLPPSFPRPFLSFPFLSSCWCCVAGCGWAFVHLRRGHEQRARQEG